MGSEIYYFGCGSKPGHYWFPKTPRGGTYYRNIIDNIDNLFIRFDVKEGEYVINQIGNLTIISWPDFSIDKRVGSNSNIVGFNYESSEELLKESKISFDWVFERLKNFTPHCSQTK